MLGYPDQALARSHEALALAQELSHAYSLGLLCILLACSINVAGKRSSSRSGLKQKWRSRSEQGFVEWLEGGMITARLGTGTSRERSEEGIAQLRQGLDVLVEPEGMSWARPHVLAQAGRGIWESRANRRRAGVLSRGLGSRA